jgi:Na+-transporting NADH:ubiquinone oxidoreductase subunit NqrE
MSFPARVERELLSENRLFVAGLGAAQAIMLTRTLFEAVLAGLCVFAVMLVTAPVAILATRTLDRKATLTVSAMIAAPVATIFTTLACSYFPILQGAQVIDYLLLVSVNSALLTAIFTARRDREPGNMVGSVVGAAAGYLIAVALVGTAREIIAYGSILAHPIPYWRDLSLEFFATAPGGMIALAFAMAIWRSFAGGGKRA